MSRLHPFLRLVIAAIGLFVAQVAAGLVLMAGYVGYQMAQTPGQPLAKVFANGALWLQENALVASVFIYPIGVLWLALCRTKIDKRSFVSLGLRSPRFVSNMSRGLLAGFLAIAVVWAMLWVTGSISVNGWSAAARSPTVVLSLLGYGLAFVAVGFFEEFLFRGYALHNLTNWLGWKWAVVAQAAIFALVHLVNVAGGGRDAQLAAWGAMPSIFLIGVFFALSYRKTGSLWFPIGFHTAWNFSLGCLFSLPVSGIKTLQLLDVQSNANAFLSGGAFGAEGSFLLPPIILALIWFMWQAPDHPQALLDLELAQPAPAQAPVVEPVAAPVLANGAAMEMEVEEDRENRYRTKFGTSAGFDETMLRELRELQQAREESEAQTRRERDAQQTAVQTELLKPRVVVEELKAEAPSQAEEAQETMVVAPEVMPVEVPQAETVRAEEVAVESVVEKPEVKAVEEPVAPESSTKQAATVEEAPRPAPAPVPKKARPKW